MNIIQQLEQEQLRSDIPDFRAGDTVRVHAKVVEGNRERASYCVRRRCRTYIPCTFPACGQNRSQKPRHRTSRKTVLSASFDR